MPLSEDFLAQGHLIYGGLVLGSVWLIQKIISVHRAPKKLPLPPGPPGLPLVGNIADLPPPGIPEWEHWVKHKDLYGPISSVTVFGQTIILLHSKEIASELLEKRSAKFSSRPTMHFAGEMVGYKYAMGFLPYNDDLRTQRRMAAKQMGSKSLIAKFFPSFDLQVGRFLLRTMNHPEELNENLQFQSASFVLDMLYGYQTISTGRDPLVEIVNQWMAEFSESTVAGAWLVDVLPWLEYLPEWLPGMSFKGTARRFHNRYMQVNSTPYEFTKKRKAEGSTKPSYVAGLLDDNLTPHEITNIMYSASALYGGGADTTVASLNLFFLAMSLNPDVQRKAQEEIDRVVGPDRLPDFQDRPNLPYVEAVLSETIRWKPIVPLCLPHTTDAEDEFRGYHIPKGSLILPSIGWFSRDPDTYPEPEKFNPERFLGPNKQLDPHTYAFGFGRRICPGRHIADADMFLVIAKTLASLNISKAVDSSGNEIEPVVEQIPGIISHPKPFKCSIKPRSERYRELIARVDIEHPPEKGDSEFITLG